MIMIDIYVPVLDKTYDFELDEHTSVQELTEKILLLIGQKEYLYPISSKESYLYSVTKNCILGRNSDLESQGVTNGERLILI